MGWWGKQIPAHRGFLKTFFILTSKMLIIKLEFLISFLTVYHEGKAGLKIITCGIQNRKLPRFSSEPPMSCSVMGIGELLSYRNAAGCEVLLLLHMILVAFGGCTL